jgi:methylmalonyl-CoA mutase N-terminal domain/subunit
MRAGVLAGIENGFFQREIQDAAYEYQQRVERGEETVVGVNAYTSDDEEDPEILKVDSGVQQRQRDRLEAVRDGRDDDAVEDALDAIDEAAASGENVVPAIIEAVKAQATMGEIMGVFEERYGSYQETVGVA